MNCITAVNKTVVSGCLRSECNGHDVLSVLCSADAVRWAVGGFNAGKNDSDSKYQAWSFWENVTWICKPTGHTGTDDITSQLKTSLSGQTAEWVYCSRSIKSLPNAPFTIVICSLKGKYGENPLLWIYMLGFSISACKESVNGGDTDCYLLQHLNL